MLSTTIAGIPCQRANNFKDLTGNVFSRWTVLEFAGTNPEKNGSSALWVCRCKCGTQKIVRSADLVKGKSKSCGCLRNEQRPLITRTHGMSKSVEYRIWKALRNRCLNPNNKSFALYRERAPDCWETFEEFFLDMGERPSSRHSIDRINNGLPYSKENCRWVLPGDQSRNTRRNRTYTFNGETKCMADWADFVGINRVTLLSRLKSGMTIDEALLKPIRKLAGRNC